MIQEYSAAEIIIGMRIGSGRGNTVFEIIKALFYITSLLIAVFCKPFESAEI